MYSSALITGTSPCVRAISAPKAETASEPSATARETSPRSRPKSRPRSSRSSSPFTRTERTFSLSVMEMSVPKSPERILLSSFSISRLSSGISISGSSINCPINSSASSALALSLSPSTSSRTYPSAYAKEISFSAPFTVSANSPANCPFASEMSTAPLTAKLSVSKEISARSASLLNRETSEFTYGRMSMYSSALITGTSPCVRAISAPKAETDKLPSEMARETSPRSRPKSRPRSSRSSSPFTRTERTFSLSVMEMSVPKSPERILLSSFSISRLSSGISISGSSINCPINSSASSALALSLSPSTSSRTYPSAYAKEISFSAPFTVSANSPANCPFASEMSTAPLTAKLSVSKEISARSASLLNRETSEFTYGRMSMYSSALITGTSPCVRAISAPKAETDKLPSEMARETSPRSRPKSRPRSSRSSSPFTRTERTFSLSVMEMSVPKSPERILLSSFSISRLSSGISISGSSINCPINSSASSALALSLSPSTSSRTYPSAYAKEISFSAPLTATANSPASCPFASEISIAPLIANPSAA